MRTMLRSLYVCVSGGVSGGFSVAPNSESGKRGAALLVEEMNTPPEGVRQPVC